MSKPMTKRIPYPSTILDPVTSLCYARRRSVRFEELGAKLPRHRCQITCRDQVPEAAVLRQLVNAQPSGDPRRSPARLLYRVQTDWCKSCTVPQCHWQCCGTSSAVHLSIVLFCCLPVHLSVRTYDTKGRPAPVGVAPKHLPARVVERPEQNTPYLVQLSLHLTRA